MQRLETALSVSLASVGNEVTLDGDEAAVETAMRCLETLIARARKGVVIDGGEIDAAIRMQARTTTAPPVAVALDPSEDLTIRTRKKLVVPRTPMQATYVRAMQQQELVFGLGPAGTGKTYLAVAMAVGMKLAGRVDRIILSRPAVEAGERLGFLPGDMRDKVDPYLRPLYDALHDMLPGDAVEKALESGDIEVAPLAFMRGRTLSNAFVILDEAQNTTATQMKMFLTRLGENSRMVVTGDLSQVDLPNGVRSGLADAFEVLCDEPAIGIVRFSKEDVMRHPLVSRIFAAYERRDTPHYG